MVDPVAEAVGVGNLVPLRLAALEPVGGHSALIVDRNGLHAVAEPCPLRPHPEHEFMVCGYDVAQVIAVLLDQVRAREGGLVGRDARQPLSGQVALLQGLPCPLERIGAVMELGTVLSEPDMIAIDEVDVIVCCGHGALEGIARVKQVSGIEEVDECAPGNLSAADHGVIGTIIGL